MDIGREEKEELLRIVRDSISSYLKMKSFPESDTPASMKGGVLGEKCGAFVTLHLQGRLRGCIGRLTSDEPLYLTVSHMAVSAAFEDPRFPALAEEEFEHLSIEISVLSPLKRVSDPASEVEVGRDGLYIVKGPYRGVLLPQVAVEHGFDSEAFLDQTCLKAGIEAGSWRAGGIEVYTFEAEVIREVGDEGEDNGSTC